MASKVIKGLTVEIGGDTTKLGQALQDVESKSSSLSSELSDINRLLKFDPGNSDLIAQKQKVLADAIGACKEKLDTLKKAEKQVQEQFEKGEVSEEQVRALKREIIATEGKMDAYEKQAKNAGKQTKDFSDKAKEAKSESGGLGKALASAAKTGFQAIGAAAGACVTGLVAAAESTREYRTAMGKLDTAFTQNGFSAETARGAYMELAGVLGDTDQAVEAANHLAKLTDNEKDLAAWTGDILPGVFATFGDSLPIEGLTEAANETAKVGQVTGPLADALNWATMSSSEWNEALSGNVNAQKAFQKALKRGESTEDAFNAALAKCSTEQERQALITAALSGLYGDAADSYREANSEVIRANQANEEWMQALSGVGGAIEPIITDVKMMGASLLSDLVPGVQKVTEAFRGMLGGEDGAAADLGAALSGIITDLMDKVTELAPTLAQVGMSLLTTLATTIITQLPQLIETGVEIIMAIIDGLTQAIPQITQAIVDMIPRLAQALVTGIPQIIQGAVQLLLAIVDAIDQILPPLIAALPSVITAIISGLMSALPDLLAGAVQLLLAIVQAIPQIIPLLLEALPTIITTIIDGLIACLPQLVDGAVQLFMALVQAIPIICMEIVKALPQIISAIVTGLLNLAGSLLSAGLELGGKLFGGVVDAVKGLPAAIGGFFSSAWEGATAAWSTVSTWATEKWNSISNAFSSVGTWFSDTFSGAWSNVETAFSTASTWATEKWNSISTAFSSVGTWFSDTFSGAWSNVETAFSTAATWATEKWNSISNAFSSAGTWFSGTFSDAWSKVTSAFSSWTSFFSDLWQDVVDVFSESGGDMLEVGKAIVQGLWSGISNTASWLWEKISGWLGGVWDGILDFFGIASPSKKAAWVGEMFDKGLAEGIADNMGDPLKAAKDVTSGVLDSTQDMNGLALERNLQQQGATRAAAAAETVESGMLAKLDKILTAIEKGQVLTIDGKKFVGATAAEIDAALGRRRALAAIGAL